MALTLLEAAKMMPAEQAVFVEEYARQSEILRVLPFRNTPNGSFSYNREDTLPGVGFRGVNEAYSEDTGVINPQVETCKIAGGDLDVDRYIVTTQGDGVRAAHEMMKVKNLAHQWSKTFVKGDTSTNPRVFDGLQVRLTGSQLISNAAAGAGLSLAKLDEAIDAVDDPMYILANKAIRRRISAAARNINVGGHVNYTPDQFGRQVMSYNDLPILEMDKGMAAADNPLPFTETSPDGSSSTSCASLYIVSLGDLKVSGIQTGQGNEPAIEVRDMGELETKPAFRTRIEWYSSFGVFHGRAAARLYGILDAAVTT